MSGVSTATILAGSSLALTAAGTAASVGGQIAGQGAAASQANQQQAWGVYAQQQQAAAQSAQAAWERSIAFQREELAQRAIDDSLQRGQVAEDLTRLGARQAMGSTRARLAAQGTDLAGSPTDIIGDVAGAGEFAAQTVRSNAVREAYGHRLELVDAQNAAALAQAKQDNAIPGLVSNSYQPSYIGAGASLLSGASNLAEKWWKFQNNGTQPKTITGGGTGDYLGYGGQPGPAF